ncbi:MAG: serine protease [Candidatus Omnitrophica bacterium]|nr:serine protease [Candidatus Omnitrophota bacterium]MDD5592384.1 serine protease [Candidatus Omnitrophota bacterium]
MKELYEVLENLQNHVVYISTPAGSGTGFLVASSEGEKVIGIATAWHVVNYAVEWDQPIKVKHHITGKTILLKEGNRSIHWDDATDSALIRLPKGQLPLPDEVLPLFEKKSHKKAGVELGWCGFPSVYPTQLCFFSGRVSAWLAEREAYLVDGVVINGVSGGPTFDRFSELVGFVTAYIPNRATGKALPGVGLIRSITPYIDWFDKLKPVPPESVSDSPLPKETKVGE